MSDDDQDFLDSLEKEATEYNKVCPPLQGIHLYLDWHATQDVEIDRIRKAFSLDS
jgi:hypothetical protein